jgi:hypothetical protein
MPDKLILAESLMEYTLTSQTQFIEASDNSELKEAAKKLGIVLPSPDLAVFQTIYAEVDKKNRNGVILPRKAVEEGLPTLVGKQINFEHEGAGRVCGYVIDAKIEDNFIVIIGCLFKSLFRDEFDKVQDLFTSNKLFVSFEIHRVDEEGNFVIQTLEDGTKRINKIVFHGCGLLLENKPACPKARVLKLLANEEVIREAEEILKQDRVKDENLIYAEQTLNEGECKNCTTCTCDGGDNRMEQKSDQETEVVASEEKTEETQVVPTEDSKKLRKCSVCGEPIDENLPAEETECSVCKEKKMKKSEEATVEIIEPVAAEAAPVTEAVAEVVEEKPVPTVVRIVREETTITVEVPLAEGGYATERRGMRRMTTEFSDGTKDVAEEQFDIVDMYTKAQLDDAVAAEKKETELVKAELEKTKIELESKTQEITEAKTEIASLKIEEEKEDESQIDLSVGNIQDKQEKYTAIRKSINSKAFGDKKSR